jgi:hypothetical protein
MRWRLAEVLEWIEADYTPQKSWIIKSNGDVDRRKKLHAGNRVPAYSQAISRVSGAKWPFDA